MRSFVTKVIGASAIAVGSLGFTPSSAQEFSPPPADYASGYVELARAAVAMEAKRYDDAVFILDDLADGTVNSNIVFFAGLANAGANNLKVARRHFSYAISMNRNHFNAQIGLAYTSIRMNDRRTAEQLLERLVARQQSCEGRCDNAVDIDRAAAAIRRALS